MTSKAPRVIGILAGGGSLPREIAQRVTARGDRVHIVAIANESSGSFAPYPVTVVGWGKIGAMIAALKSGGCRDLVIVGSVRRPDLLAIRPDLGLWRNLPTIVRIIAAGGDDGVLTRVVRFFEEQGFRVAAPGDIAPELLVGEGPLGQVVAQAQAQADAALGFDLLRRLGPYDVGQAAVVAGGSVLAVEGPEGTDRMLGRVAQRRTTGDLRATSAGVLVKRPKPGQELRIDMPAIGPETVRRAGEAGLIGIAVLAGSTLVAERPVVVREADAEGLFVQGFTERSRAMSSPPARPAWRLERLGRRVPRERHHLDAGKAADLLAAIDPVVESHAVVVDRGHVRSVESGEGVGASLQRAGRQRQWGAWRLRGSALAVVREPGDVAAAVAAGAETGLAGVAVLGEPSAETAKLLQDAVEDADRRGLFVARLARGGSA